MHSIFKLPGKPTSTIRRRVANQLFAFLIAALIPTPTWPADDDHYPVRPIKIIVPFPAGGPTDVAARLIAQALSSRLGQSFVVENLAGAGGRIGVKAVGSANPDGYTLLLGGTNVNAIIGALYKDLGFDPIKSFAPISAICVDSMALVISPRVPADSFDQFVRYAKKNPGKVRYGAPAGVYTQFASEFFKVKTGTDILFVPYKGAAPAITDLLGGHIEMVFNTKSVLLQHIKEGKLKALAVTSEVRWPELPSIPTIGQVGISGFPKEVVFGLLAPAGTSIAIVEKLNRSVTGALNSPDVRASLARLGVEAKIGTAADFGVVLGEQTREWKTVIDATGIKID
jgi:tripartite-type tricarboxylate transporter receptor subunit TctC